MQRSVQIVLLILGLVCAGLAAVIYKHWYLGFPLWPSSEREVWHIEARLQFEADGGPVTVRLNLPEDDPARTVVYAQPLSPGYEYQQTSIDGVRTGQWTASQASGPQTLFLRVEMFYDQTVSTPSSPPRHLRHGFSGSQLTAAQTVLADAPVADTMAQVSFVLEKLNFAGDDAHMLLLLNGRENRFERLQVAADLLALLKLPARPVSGVHLQAGQRKQAVSRWLEVYADGQWQRFDPGSMKLVPRHQSVILQRGQEPLMEVYGGENSQLRFSTMKELQSGFSMALKTGKLQQNALVDFSIYSLPIADQNTFQLLLLIPLGALVVVILRNLVGIRTSGTFMPILIALTFMQTTLLVGLLLFLTVVALGLVLRAYLSLLNLLLVPRISAVLVFVIIIYAAIGISSFKLGVDWGLKVTFFPMIILAWTIERMSILWEEEGAHEVLVQGSGSLITAVLAYLLMSNNVVASVVFIYPEALLLVLAVIIWLGTYTGYRLSDLRRFEPMEHL
jgi:hypothetical protein